MKIIRPCSEREMLWQWLRAEVESDRFSRYYGLPPGLLERVRSGASEALTDSDWRQIAQAVRSVRFPILEGLIRLGVKWYVATIGLGEVTQLRVMNWPALVELSSDRTVGSLAATLDRGKASAQDPGFAEAYHRGRSAFALTSVRGAPILVASSDSEDGPYTVLEGYRRLTTIASKCKSEELQDGELEVMLGVCTALPAWRLWDGRTQRETALSLY